MILAGGGEKGAVGALGQLMANMKASFVKPKSRTSDAAQARARDMVIGLVRSKGRRRGVDPVRVRGKLRWVCRIAVQ